MENNHLSSDIFLLLQQKQENSKVRCMQGLQIYSSINSIPNIISNRQELYTCYSDLMNSQMFYNLYKSSQVGRCQFNHQWSNYLIGYTFCHQSEDTFMVMEKQESHVPFNFTRQCISKFFEGVECVLHIPELLKMLHGTSYPRSTIPFEKLG